MFGTRRQEDNELTRLIKRATDGALANDNWQYNLEVCDEISRNPEDNTKIAIKAVADRLESKDANVMLRTLTLLVAIAENCGSRMKQEIASRSFVNDKFLKKLADKKIHKDVKTRIAEVIEQLHNSFKTDPSLKPMSDAYKTLNSEYNKLLPPKAPVKPEKKNLSQVERVKEEEELQRVLKLSLKEYEREQAIKTHPTNNKKDLPNLPSEESRSLNKKANKTEEVGNKNIATISKVRALYDLISYEPDELSFRKGDIITVIESVYRDWWRGSLPNGKVGIFPLNYVTPVISKSPEELEKEVEAENQILLTEQRKIERLLTLLSSDPSVVNEDEVNDLYSEIIPLKRNIGQYIEKYSTRKDELSALNFTLNKEIKTYNDLMDRLISQRTQGKPYTSLPYPTSHGNENNSFDDRVDQGGNLESQHTSFGFGNFQNNFTHDTSMIPPHGNTFSNRPNGSNIGGQEPIEHSQFSNVNSFPALDKL
ncbi:Piso0_005443 [Millerozyma farinosa CBS 7064]|uniref:Class E vacuolar protein-sorting machinery protein HSE1 n=1 Tax=Pichia sorbitophila (strain ATCC MYA-4447 / BCRC 22081 / CBS 7064 / NBRC 10061 / NRRL Y-12695) TaxID=559304 RepID=G8Y540_PICSO|nr:Piso0_005443 [Millerozyma farinosa CBS 7064]